MIIGFLRNGRCALNWVKLKHFYDFVHYNMYKLSRSNVSTTTDLHGNLFLCSSSCQFFLNSLLIFFSRLKFAMEPNHIWSSSYDINCNKCTWIQWTLSIYTFFLRKSVVGWWKFSMWLLSFIGKSKSIDRHSPAASTNIKLNLPNAKPNTLCLQFAMRDRGYE